ncbi:MAG: DUF5666 domain-containing protein [Armatimonadota bacterium]
MSYKLLLVGLVFSMAMISLGAFADGKTESSAAGSSEMTVTGTVTARTGNLVTLAADDGKTYKVDATGAIVLLDRLPGNCLSLRIGDKMRVYGKLTGNNSLKASRVHIFLSDTEAAATGVPTGAGAGAKGDDSDVRLPSVGDTLGNWRNRGLVLDVRYSDRLVTVATSKGEYLIDVSVATIVDTNKTVSIARIGQGDAVRIWGELSGLNKIRADRIEILRGRGNQEASVPLKSVSMKGQIVYIDYPSFTFKLKTDSVDVSVLSDENTFIQLQSERKAFQYLAVGQTVKVDAVGSLNTGYVASRILVIGDPGR